MKFTDRLITGKGARLNGWLTGDGERKES